jgi:putative addiction module component (TIGR02574 family)
VVDTGLIAYTRGVTAQARKILEEALSLPNDDRQRLAEALLDSIPAEIAEKLEKTWNAEALRRAEAFERGEVQSIDDEHAIDSLRSKLSEANGA